MHQPNSKVYLNYRFRYKTELNLNSYTPMIALPSIAFGGFSGSAKGVTARYQNGRSILSLKSYPTGYATAAQLVRRSSLSRISKAYKNLTDAQMKAWENLAEQTSGKSVFGQKAKLSAHNLFVRLNSNRAYCGEEELLTLPPDSIVNIPIVEYDSFTMTESVILLTEVPDAEGNFVLVAKMSDGQSKGVSSSWNKTVIISPDKVPDWGDVELTDAFVAVFGHYPIAGQKYFLELYWMDPATGFTGLPLKLSAVCEAGDNVQRRLTYKNSDIMPEEENYFTEMDIEFAPGSTIMTAEIEYDSTEHDSQQAVCHISQAVGYRIPNFRSYTLGRSLEDTGYIPHYFILGKSKSYPSYEIYANKRGGPWEKKGIIFGTCPVFE